MGNEFSSGEGDVEALLPPLIFRLERLLWPGMDEVVCDVCLLESERKGHTVGQISCSSPIPQPLVLQAASMNSFLKLSFYRASANQQLASIVLPVKDLARLGLPLYTSLWLGLKMNEMESSFDEAMERSRLPDAPKVCIAIFKPCPRSYSDVNGVVSTSGECDEVEVMTQRQKTMWDVLPRPDPFGAFQTYSDDDGGAGCAGREETHGISLPNQVKTLIESLYHSHELFADLQTSIFRQGVKDRQVPKEIKTAKITICFQEAFWDNIPGASCICECGRTGVAFQQVGGNSLVCPNYRVGEPLCISVRRVGGANGDSVMAQQSLECSEFYPKGFNGMITLLTPVPGLPQGRGCTAKMNIAVAEDVNPVIAMPQQATNATLNRLKEELAIQSEALECMRLEKDELSKRLQAMELLRLERDELALRLQETETAAAEHAPTSSVMAEEATLAELNKWKEESARQSKAMQSLLKERDDLIASQVNGQTKQKEDQCIAQQNFIEALQSQLKEKDDLAAQQEASIFELQNRVRMNSSQEEALQLALESAERVNSSSSASRQEYDVKLNEAAEREGDLRRIIQENDDRALRQEATITELRRAKDDTVRQLENQIARAEIEKEVQTRKLRAELQVLKDEESTHRKNQERVQFLETELAEARQAGRTMPASSPDLSKLHYEAELEKERKRSAEARQLEMNQMKDQLLKQKIDMDDLSRRQVEAHQADRRTLEAKLESAIKLHEASAMPDSPGIRALREIVLASSQAREGERVEVTSHRQELVSKTSGTSSASRKVDELEDHIRLLQQEFQTPAADEEEPLAGSKREQDTPSSPTPKISLAAEERLGKKEQQGTVRCNNCSALNMINLDGPPTVQCGSCAYEFMVVPRSSPPGGLAQVEEEPSEVDSP